VADRATVLVRLMVAAPGIAAGRPMKIVVAVKHMPLVPAVARLARVAGQLAEATQAIAGKSTAAA
jgi:hypothetical protein